MHELLRAELAEWRREFAIVAAWGLWAWRIATQSHGRSDVHTVTRLDASSHLDRALRGLDQNATAIRSAADLQQKASVRLDAAKFELETLIGELSTIGLNVRRAGEPVWRPQRPASVETIGAQA